MKKLEHPNILVEEFKSRGETIIASESRAAEKIFQQYTSKVDEVSYDSCHMLYNYIFIMHCSMLHSTLPL